jgi:hypothetical protein
MLRISLAIVLFSGISAWSQVDVVSTTTNDSQMAVPPPVSVGDYPTVVGAQAESNYLSGGLAIQTGYIDNLSPGNSTSRINTFTYMIQPTLSIDQTTSRRQLTLTYRPGVTLYQSTSGLDEVSQSAIFDYRCRLTPRASIEINDAFLQSSSPFALSDSVAAGTVTGSPKYVSPGIVVPYTERITNNASGQISYQYSPVGMVGVSGTSTVLRYPDSSNSQDLYNSDEVSISGFLNRQINASHYLGVNYAYSRVLAYPQVGQSETAIQSVFAFYTFYLKKTVSISVESGPQYYVITETPLPQSSAWGPLVMGSVGWQARRVNVAANFSHQVTAGGGLLGAYDTTTSTISANWQILRTWSTQESANYSINKPLGPAQFQDKDGGHSISGFASLQHSIGTKMTVSFEYDWLHQRYAGIEAVSNNPDSNRVAVALNWQFLRPLGR